MRGLQAFIRLKQTARLAKPAKRRRKVLYNRLPLWFHPSLNSRRKTIIFSCWKKRNATRENWSWNENVTSGREATPCTEGTDDEWWAQLWTPCLICTHLCTPPKNHLFILCPSYTNQVLRLLVKESVVDAVVSRQIMKQINYEFVDGIVLDIVFIW